MRRWWYRFAALLVVGIVLSPLRAAAAMIPTFIAYDVAAGCTATLLGKHNAVRLEPGHPRINAYDAAHFGYESEGQLFTLDNRRLLAFSQAGREVPFTMVDATNPAIAREIAKKATTTAAQGWGQFITVLP
jgi:hypothetical protein